jgi:hypothetical protein
LIEGYLKENPQEGRSEKLADFYHVWFSFINYLLLTNVFIPNDKVDQISLGTGAYKDKQLEIRTVLTKEIITTLFKDIPSQEILSEDLLAKLRLTDLRQLGQKMRLNARELGKKREILVKKLFRSVQNPTKKPTIESWLGQQTLDKPVWQKLTRRFMKERTPPFLVKNVGLAEELYVLLTLMRKDMGYVIPLLLHQRLFTRIKNAATDKDVFLDKYVCYPTDFLLLKRGRAIAVELGSGKPDLMSTFAAVSGLPTVYINTVIKNAHFDIERDFGYKCNMCMLSYTICDKYTQMFSKGKENEVETTKLTCADLCGKKIATRCEDAIVRVKIDHKTYEVHYQCLSKHLPDEAKKVKVNDLFPLFPEVKGLKEMDLGF